MDIRRLQGLNEELDEILGVDMEKTLSTKWTDTSNKHFKVQKW